MAGLPEPAVHDEFSYLLQADTFLHGRLANPPHPLWPHFETFHVLQQPTYASRYPPGQAAFLALGRLAFGHPIAGVWLSGAILAVATLWMLAGWTPRSWALLGALFVALRLGLGHYWAQSYWGGNVAALGGALLLGGVARLLRRPSTGAALATSAGIAVLANTRPYEGAVLTLAAGIAAAGVLLARRRRGRPGVPARLVLTMAGLLLLTGAWIAYYDARVTGDPWTLPWQAYRQAYSTTPYFLWEDPRPAPPYRNAALEEFHTRVEPYIADAQDPMPGRVLHRLRDSVVPLTGRSLLWVFLAVPWALRRRGAWIAATCAAASLAALVVSRFFFFHYVAPMTPAIVLLFLQSLRAWRRLRAGGIAIGRLAVPLALAVLVASTARAVWQGLSAGPWADHEAPTAFARARAELSRRLRATPRPDLVVVRYAPGHCVHDEWVYDDADIDGSPVVWARDLGAEADRALLDHFRGREAWLLTVGPRGSAPVLEPYPVDARGGG